MNESRLSNGLFLTSFLTVVLCVVATASSCTSGNGPGPETADASTVDTDSTPDSAAEDVPAADVPAVDTGSASPPAEGARSSANIFFLGHSLLGWDAPTMLAQFAEANGLTYSFDAAVGIGANLSWQWQHPDRAQGENPRTALSAQPYDLLVLTEAVPIANQVQGADSVQNALNFMQLAYEQNPDVQVYLYETWEHRENDAWRDSIREVRTFYDQIVDGVNARFDGRDMLIIPGGQAMGALVDSIRAGDVPGVSDEGALFVDDIHLTPLGWYFIACVHYATIYQRSPVGVPVETIDRFENPFTAPPAAAAAVMQQIAWDVVSGEARSGVTR
ncbi:MAG: hypothetical protein ACI9KE_002810 [Polyangiales bacterium]|jgi:hypothetical protein